MVADASPVGVRSLYSYGKKAARPVRHQTMGLGLLHPQVEPALAVLNSKKVRVGKPGFQGGHPIPRLVREVSCMKMRCASWRQRVKERTGRPGLGSRSNWGK